VEINLVVLECVWEKRGTSWRVKSHFIIIRDIRPENNRMMNSSPTYTAWSPNIPTASTPFFHGTRVGTHAPWDGRGQQWEKREEKESLLIQLLPVFLLLKAATLLYNAGPLITKRGIDCNRICRRQHPQTELLELVCRLILSSFERLFLGFVDFLFFYFFLCLLLLFFVRVESTGSVHRQLTFPRLHAIDRWVGRQMLFRHIAVWLTTMGCESLSPLSFYFFWPSSRN
jgi:hypothetical protein